MFFKFNSPYFLKPFIKNIFNLARLSSCLFKGTKFLGSLISRELNFAEDPNLRPKPRNLVSLKSNDLTEKLLQKHYKERNSILFQELVTS